MAASIRASAAEPTPAVTHKDGVQRSSTSLLCNEKFRNFLGNSEGNYKRFLLELWWEKKNQNFLCKFVVTRTIAVL